MSRFFFFLIHCSAVPYSLIRFSNTIFCPFSLVFFVHLKEAFFILMTFKFSLYRATLLHFIKRYIPKHWNGMRTLLHGVFHISIVCNLIRFCTVCLANYIYILHFFCSKNVGQSWSHFSNHQKHLVDVIGRNLVLNIFLDSFSLSLSLSLSLLERCLLVFVCVLFKCEFS